ncbi:polysaccharide biosynthesis/export family protein [Methylocaldum szegediense]|uniref:Polysaccharide biosynthesis/export protein n=1 Tax=Methylocaldum szegediense TaxID=73780 RepID=A0ABN8X4N2_9GAMM|nr:polysaccharide biosynthesis/export family protein [Methylocaldum szegediense]CAI8784101.1 polysaccharide biosynthesis/export protein [Methylocaldum szegediense]
MFQKVFTLLLLFIFANSALTDEANPTPLLQMPQNYRLVPGDVLEISVWREEGLTKQVLVRADGGISFPLVGDLQAGGLTVEDVRAAVTERLAEYLADPVVSVSVITTSQRIYVVGKVNKPGEFVTPGRVTVMHALALAGGLNPFADRDDITILRQVGDRTTPLPFDYDAVAAGKDLEQNILLMNGDVVVVR